MSVVGIGIDLVSIPMFAEQLRQPGTAFAQGNFTVAERRDSAAGTGRETRHLAVRWAAKEAVIKAWSTSRYGRSPVLKTVPPTDIEVVTDAWRRPAIRLSGEIAEHLRDCIIHLSLTHDGDTAGAVAVIEDSK